MGPNRHSREGPANCPGRFRSYRNDRNDNKALSDLRAPVAAQNQLSTSRTADKRSPTPSAAHRVFAIPELLEMILTRLPPGPLHHAMQVSKRFHDAIDPKAPSSVSSMRVALGLLCRRKIEDMTPSEHAELAHRDGAPATPRRLFYDAPQQTLHRRFHWLLNVTLDPVDVSVVRDTCFVPVPTLSIAGSNTIRIVRGDHAGRGGNSRRSGDESSNILTLNFSYVAKGFEQDKPTARGIIRSIVKSKDTLCPLDPGAGWFDVKILTMPFDVRVCVSVDFRDAMQATGHHVGPCRYFGCQVGNHGVQETSILFPAEQATLGNLLKFLDSAETDAIEKAKIIRRQTECQPHSLPYREPYYLGFPAPPPPRLDRERQGWW